jgi:hypothetical protein
MHLSPKKLIVQDNKQRARNRHGRDPHQSTVDEIRAAFGSNATGCNKPKIS